MVRKDYGIVAYFVPGFRYNEQALVYSGLLACNAGLASKHAGYRACYRAVIELRTAQIRPLETGGRPDGRMRITAVKQAG
jgi:hypothetical protein